MPRWLKVSLALVVSVGVLAGAGELILRAIVPHIVASSVRESLHIPKSHEVDVQVSGSALLNALTGATGRVEVEVPDAPIADGVTATLSLEADRVPFAVTSGEMSNARATMFVPAEKLGPVISFLTSGVADSGKTSGDSLVVGKKIEAFGFSVELEATLHLSVENGDVRVVPEGLSAVGFDLSAEQLASATGGLLDPLLEPRVVCVADRLPAGITPRDITIAPSGARVQVNVSDDFLSNPAKQELGSCA